MSVGEVHPLAVSMRKRRVLMDLDALNLAFVGQAPCPQIPISSNSMCTHGQTWSPKMMTLLGSVLRLPVVKFVEPVRTNAFASSRSPTMNCWHAAAHAVRTEMDGHAVVDGAWVEIGILSFGDVTHLHAVGNGRVDGLLDGRAVDVVRWGQRICAEVM